MKAYACCRELSDAAIGLKAQDVETNKVIELAKKVPFCFAAASAGVNACLLQLAGHAKSIASCTLFAVLAEPCSEFGVGKREAKVSKPQC